MIIIRSPADLTEARLPPHLHTLTSRHLQNILEENPHFNPEDDGYLVVITSTDTDATLGQQLGQRWQNDLFEGVRYDDEYQCFVAVILRDNQFAITILIPDESWLDPLIRQRLLLELPPKQHIPPLPDR